MQKHFILTLMLGLLIYSSQAQIDAIKKATGAGTPNAGSLLSQFAGALKPTSFLPSWGSGGKTSWLDAASKVKDAAGMGNSISSLTGFIKPGMFKSGFDVASLSQSAGSVKTLSTAAGLLKNLEGGLKPLAFLSSWAGQRSGWLSALSLLK